MKEDTDSDKEIELKITDNSNKRKKEVKPIMKKSDNKNLTYDNLMTKNSKNTEENDDSYKEI
jgi:hypothetical protein